jgi:hypothetical protein
VPNLVFKVGIAIKKCDIGTLKAVARLNTVGILALIFEILKAGPLLHYSFWEHSFF